MKKRDCFPAVCLFSRIPLKGKVRGKKGAGPCIMEGKYGEKSRAGALKKQGTDATKTCRQCTVYTET
jgi:hypothetical protein